MPNDSTRSAAREPLGEMEVSGSGRVAVQRPDALRAVSLVERPRLVLDMAGETSNDLPRFITQEDMADSMIESPIAAMVKARSPAFTVSMSAALAFGSTLTVTSRTSIVPSR